MNASTDTRTTVTLAVSGMSCGSCRAHVEEALAATPGVARAEVDLAAGRATVAYDPALATPERLAEAVREAGYGAEPTAGRDGCGGGCACGC